MDQAAGRNGFYRSLAFYVAAPAVLHLLGINPATIKPAANILAIGAGQDDLTTIAARSGHACGRRPRRLGWERGGKTYGRGYGQR